MFSIWHVLGISWQYETFSATIRKLKDFMTRESFFCTHGLRTPNEAFFHRNPKLLGLGRQLVQINFGAFGVFSADLSAPILVQWAPCPCYQFTNHYFYKKLSLYIQIPNIYLGLGFEFEFGLQRFSHHVSIVRGRRKNGYFFMVFMAKIS